MSGKNIEEEGLDDDEEELGEEELDDEELDEEEEEEEEDSRKKKKKKKAFSFVINEAEEDDDDEDESDDDDELEREAADPKFVDDGDESSRISEHRKIQRILRDVSQEDLVDQAQYYEERYKDYGNDLNLKDVDKITPAALQPTPADPNLWIIKCRVSSTRRLALALMRKFFDRLHTDPLEICSVITCDHVKEYIYIEARKRAHVEKAIENLNGFIRSSLKLIPQNEMVDVLSVKKKEPSKLQPGSWVRLRKGVYAGDLGRVSEIDDDRGVATVQCIPRIDLNQGEAERDRDVDGKGKKRKRSSIRPPAQLLTRVLEDHKDLNRYVTTSRQRDFIEFRGDRYKAGFLYKDHNITTLDIEGVTPTLDELQHFQSSKDGESGERAIQSMLSNLTNATGELSASAYKKGETVEVTVGELEGVIGIVQGVEGNVVSILARKEDSKEMVIRVDPNDIRKFFEIGDHVRVLRGRFEGETGSVVKIESSIVTIITDTSRQEIQVFSKDLEKARDRSAPVTAIGNFALFDFVNIDATNVGVIVRVEKESLKIVDQNGTVRTTRAQEITSRKTFRNFVSVDRHRNNIKAGDAVTVGDGPHKGKQTKILHLFRNSAFLLSHEIPENSGVIVIATKNVTLVGGDKSRKEPSKDPFQPPAPRQVNEKRRAPHPELSKLVKIIKGPFKGHQGTISAVHDQSVQVVLHSRPKPISLTWDQIKTIDQVQRPSSSSFDGSRTPSYAGNQTPSYNAGNRTPAYNSGNRTPAYDGGMTPGYDGLAGSRTPAWDTGPRSSYLSSSSWASDSATPVTPGHIPSTPLTDLPNTPRSDYVSDIATPYENPDTPSTPYAQPYAYSGNVPQTPGNIPSTPGISIPQTPVYTSSTPGRTPGTPSTPGGYPQTPFSGNDTRDDDRRWVVPGLEVSEHGSTRRGVVRAVNGETCFILFEGSQSTIPVQASSLGPVRPSKSDMIRVIGGDHKGEVGELLNIEGSEAIVNLGNGSEWTFLPIEDLCKVRPDS